MIDGTVDFNRFFRANDIIVTEWVAKIDGETRYLMAAHCYADEHPMFDGVLIAPNVSDFTDRRTN